MTNGAYCGYTKIFLNISYLKSCRKDCRKLYVRHGNGWSENVLE